MKTCLVLEGGAMRGMYTAGALDVFYNAGIKFDGIIGVSAGAAFGVNYLSGQPGRVIRYNKRFNADRHYMGLIPLLKTGNIVDTDYAYDKVPRELDPFDGDTFDASGVPFWAVVTNVETGRAEYIRLEHAMEQMDVIRASASMPFVSKPVKLGGKLYLDGGVADSIPFKAAEKLGFDRVVVILTRDRSYVKKPMASGPIEVWYKHYPAFMEQLKNRHSTYNNAVRELLNWEQQGKAWVLHPSLPIEIGGWSAMPTGFRRSTIWGPGTRRRRCPPCGPISDSPDGAHHLYRAAGGGWSLRPAHSESQAPFFHPCRRPAHPGRKRHHGQWRSRPDGRHRSRRGHRIGALR